MPLPDFIRALPALELPFPDDVLSTYAMRTDDALTVFFEVHRDISIPEHAHGAQWGHMIAGSGEAVIDGKRLVLAPGVSWDLPAGTPHAFTLHAGSVVVDVFSEADRYPLRA